MRIVADDAKRFGVRQPSGAMGSRICISHLSRDHFSASLAKAVEGYSSPKRFGLGLISTRILAAVALKEIANDRISPFRQRFAESLQDDWSSPPRYSLTFANPQARGTMKNRCRSFDPDRRRTA